MTTPLHAPLHAGTAAHRILDLLRPVDSTHRGALDTPVNELLAKLPRSLGTRT